MQPLLPAWAIDLLQAFVDHLKRTVQVALKRQSFRQSELQVRNTDVTPEALPVVDTSAQ
jgi:hypothetical protein